MSIVNAGAARNERPLVIRGAGVVTMDRAVGDYLVADIHVRDGRIAEIRPDLSIADAEVIEAGAMIAMPGFIDGHRHLWEGVIRNTLPTEDLEGYFRMVNMGFAQGYEPDDVYLGTLVSALGALDSGITSVFDWSHIQTTPDHTAAAITALRESGLRTIFGYGPAGADDRGSQWPHDLLRLQRDEFASTDQLLTLALAGYSPEHVPDEMAKSLFKLAREAGLVISVHAGLNGMGEPHQIERFGNEGLLGPDVNLVHCNTLTPVEWAIIAETGTSVAITPSTEMQMGQGVPPIQRALDAGVRPSLGVDVETSIPSDMWTQMRVTYALQRSNAFELRYAGKEPPAMMDVTDLLECATTAGAASARLDDKVGRLAPGLQADIILLRTDMLNVVPVNDMRTAIALNMDVRNVDTVMVAGRIVKRDGRMIGVDIAKLTRRLYDSRDRVFAASNLPCHSPVHRLQH